MNIAIMIHSEEDSKHIQEWLFKEKYQWIGTAKRYFNVIHAAKVDSKFMEEHIAPTIVVHYNIKGNKNALSFEDEAHLKKYYPMYKRMSSEEFMSKYVMPLPATMKENIQDAFR